MGNLSRSLLFLILPGGINFSLAAGPDALHVRLENPLTSYSSPQGTPFRATVVSSFESNGRVVIPSGSILTGTVRRALRVGLGLRRERARLELSFDNYQLADGRRFPLDARLDSIDNARETVTARGEIKGILAANNPHALMQGIWYRPSLTLVHRSVVGLTGASGIAWTRSAMGPAGAAGLLALRLAVVRMAEPEIRLPAGTEMQLQVSRLPAEAPSHEQPASQAIPLELAQSLADQPAQVAKANRKPSADVIHLAFIGSRRQVQQAFETAGWSAAEPLTARTLARTYRAYSSLTGYASAPVSRLLYQGADASLVYQKGLNTITKRHHVRIWKAKSVSDREIWLGAGTHDVGITLDSGTMMLTHKIDPMIDGEREKIIRDLVFAGCSEPARYVDRPQSVQMKSTGKEAITDGRLAVLVLRDCVVPQLATAGELPDPPGSRLTRLARRVTLETRNYLLRGNVYYMAYRAVRWRAGAAPQPVSIEE